MPLTVRYFTFLTEDSCVVSYVILRRNTERVFREGQPSLFSASNRVIHTPVTVAANETKQRDCNQFLARCPKIAGGLCLLSAGGMAYLTCLFNQFY